MADFLHLYVRQRPGVTQETLEAVLSLAEDWYRYDSRMYILYTTDDPDKWKERLVPLVNPGGRYFICPLEVKPIRGRMAGSFWKWIRSKPEGVRNST